MKLKKNQDPDPSHRSCEKTSLDGWREQRDTEFLARRYFR